MSPKRIASAVRRTDRLAQPIERHPFPREALEPRQRNGTLAAHLRIERPARNREEAPLRDIKGIDGLLVVVIQEREDIDIRLTA
jgi:hypothetical protein